MISKSRFFILQMMIASALMFIVAGCSKDKDNDDINNDITAIEPLIHAGVLNSGNPVEATGINVAIVDVIHQGAAVTNAIVKVNNQAVPHASSGMYQLIITDNPILPGSTVILEVQCGGETYNASSVMPASGETNVPISGCADGSFLLCGHN